ncbi:MAG: hypothetical protein WC307_04335 [Candidatus Nanoarchaeia archaeon]|jgi:hypothetical protein
MGLIIDCEDKTFEAFVKESYRIASAVMKIDINQFPSLIQLNLIDLKENDLNIKLKTYRHLLNKISNGLGDEELRYYQEKVKQLSGIDKEKLLSSNMIFCTLYEIINLKRVGGHYNDKNNVIFMPISNPSPYTLGEELFHFVHNHYKKREVDGSIHEFFGYLGRLYLYTLFERYNKKWINYFPKEDDETVHGMINYKKALNRVLDTMPKNNPKELMKQLLPYQRLFFKLLYKISDSDKKLMNEFLSKKFKPLAFSNHQIATTFVFIPPFKKEDLLSINLSVNQVNMKRFFKEFGFKDKEIRFMHELTNKTPKEIIKVIFNSIPKTRLYKDTIKYYVSLFMELTEGFEKLNKNQKFLVLLFVKYKLLTWILIQILNNDYDQRNYSIELMKASQNHDKGYPMAYDCKDYPSLDLAIKNPGEFYNKTPEEIIKQLKTTPRIFKKLRASKNRREEQAINELIRKQLD